MITEELLNSLTANSKARLFPVGKDANHERGITSIFLATLSVVKNYASGVLDSIDRKSGVRSYIECHTEIIFPQEVGNDRPDGLIILRNGKKIIWSALVEAKVGKAELSEEQISRYLALAKQYKIDAVITISNQFAVLPTHHPLKVPKTLTRNVDLYHWSWTFLRTQAEYQLSIEEDFDQEQKYILKELIRYFDHKSSGVQSFDSMNKEWRNICLKIKNQEHLLKSSDEVLNTISSWHQKQRDIALMLTRKLDTPVTIKLSKAHKFDPEKRLKDDANTLCKNEALICRFLIPQAASILTVEAKLSNRTITSSMELLAPGDKKSTKAKVNWLVRQLAKTENDNIRIGARWPGRTKETWKTLSELRENPNALQTENAKLIPYGFIVQTVLDMAGRFSGQRTFIEGLEKTVTEFYQAIGENLSAWVPPAPKFEEKLNEELEKPIKKETIIA